MYVGVELSKINVMIFGMIEDKIVMLRVRCLDEFLLIYNSKIIK